MRTHSFHRFASVCLVALLASCTCSPPIAPDGGSGGGGGIGGGIGGGSGGGTGGGGDGGGAGGGSADDGGAAVAAFCAALATARCEREAACGFVAPMQATTCPERLERSCLDALVRVAAGAATFDGAGAAACLVALSGERCIAGPFAMPPACEASALVDAAALEGEGCADSADCVQGFCFGTTRECRTCRAFVLAGQPCNLTSRRCDAPGWCSTPPDGGATVCAPPRADGEACGAHRECATGWCNYNDSVPGAGPDVCGRRALGAPCGDADDCAPGAYCAGYWFDGTTVTPGVCTARLGLGQPCANHPDDDGCVEPATCLEGRCVAVTPFSLDAGAECEDLSSCAEPLYCLGFEAQQPDGGRSLRSGVCTARLAPGAPCDFATYVDTDCAQDATCGANFECVARADAGTDCAAGWECLDFLACPVGGQCEPYRAPGSACGPGHRCTDGAGDGFCALDGGAGVCVARRVVGELCEVSALGECASARCFAQDGGAATCQPACLP